jgi:hypothetical protein
MTPASSSDAKAALQGMRGPPADGANHRRHHGNAGRLRDAGAAAAAGAACCRTACIAS